MQAKWKTCSHKWVSVPHHSAFGVVHQDECSECGCIGVISNSPDENGFYQIVAQPMAEVIDLNEFRKRKEVRDGDQKANSSN